MELSRQALIDRISGKVTSIEDFNFDNLVAPPLSALLTMYDIDCLYNIATSVKYSGNPQKKYQAIDKIMRSRGFVKLSAGTNRVVYKHLESNGFVVKVAADAIGIKDNPREFQNQFIFKPFVTKVFEVSPCGTVGVFEKVNPIESREEFLSVADDIFDVINEWFIGKYIMADIGTKFFMNWGIRTYNVGKEGSVAFGPVLLDFPYVYELDGNKLFCSAVDKNNLETGVCGGVIDYDSGFNFLHCTKCGTRYRVRELAKKIKNNEIKIDRRRESKKMVVGRYDANGNIVVDDQVITKSEEKKVNKPVQRESKPSGTLTINMDMVYNRKTNNSNEKKNHKPANNNSLRSNPANSRGIVKAPATSNIKVDLPVAKEIVEEKKEYDKLVEYNAEYDIIVLSNGDNEITAKLSKIIPEDYINTITIENGADHTELLITLDKNKELEEELDRVKSASDKNFEEFADEKEKYEKLLAEKDAEIAKKDAEIEELKKKLSNVKSGIPVNRNPEFDVSAYSAEYDDAIIIHAVVENLSGFTTVKKDNPFTKVLVFPSNEAEAEYFNDEDRVIAVATINGYSIDELIEKVEDKKTEE